jgi:NAD(P)H-nitrite reductase large subunit
MVGASGVFMHVAIIGNGIAGVTAARTLRKRDPKARITMISAESEHHWSRPALMYIYMGHMRYQDTKPYQDHFWGKNRIDLVRGWVTQIDAEGKTLTLDGQRTVQWDKLLIATGSKPNMFGWPGQDLNRVSGMYSLQDMDALEGWTRDIKHGVVVGGGLIGIELAEMLHSRGRHVTMLVREASYWDNALPAEESAMVNEVIRATGIDLRLGAEMASIEDDGTGSVGAVQIKDGELLDAHYVGLTAGVRPNITVTEGSSIETARGILVNNRLQTNHPDIYAAGDCAEIRTPEGERNTIQAVWYTGRFQGEQVANNMVGDAGDYDAGLWFNSAKFIDIEYQVYGNVPASSTQHTSGLDYVFWKHDNGKHSVRICHKDGVVVGFNLMGVRFRHKVCEDWILQAKPLDYVLKNLRQAAFDPEFAKRHDSAIRAAATGASA